MNALGVVWSEGMCCGNKRMARVPERIMAVNQRNPEATMIEEWVKVCGASDMYEGKNKRLSLGLRGKIPTAPDEVGALELLQKKAEEGLATFRGAPTRPRGRGTQWTSTAMSTCTQQEVVR
ncbi:MAG: hypothetical protein ACKPKO_40465, partial [Candidatus Fonsibacter sp.]